MSQTELMLISGAGTLWLAVTGWTLMALIQIKTDMAGLKVYVADALNLKPQVKENSVNIVRLHERQDRHKKDIDALHKVKREIMEDLKHGRGK